MGLEVDWFTLTQAPICSDIAVKDCQAVMHGNMPIGWLSQKKLMHATQNVCFECTMSCVVRVCSNSHQLCFTMLLRGLLSILCMLGHTVLEIA